jgi:hypothetical protein
MSHLLGFWISWKGSSIGGHSSVSGAFKQHPLDIDFTPVSKLHRAQVIFDSRVFHGNQVWAYREITK